MMEASAVLRSTGILKALVVTTYAAAWVTKPKPPNLRASRRSVKPIAKLLEKVEQNALGRV